MRTDTDGNTQNVKYKSYIINLQWIMLEEPALILGRTEHVRNNFIIKIEQRAVNICHGVVAVLNRSFSLANPRIIQ